MATPAFKTRSFARFANYSTCVNEVVAATNRVVVNKAANQVAALRTDVTGMGNPLMVRP